MNYKNIKAPSNFLMRFDIRCAFLRSGNFKIYNKLWNWNNFFTVFIFLSYSILCLILFVLSFIRYKHLGQFAPLGGEQAAAQLPGDWISIGHSTQWLWYSVYARLYIYCSLLFGNYFVTMHYSMFAMLAYLFTCNYLLLYLMHSDCPLQQIIIK